MAISLIFVLWVYGIISAKPSIITYSTYLTNAEGKPRSLSGQLVYFRLFADSTGGTAIWEEQHGIIAPSGFVSVQLGSIEPLPLRAIESSNQLWLEMQIINESPFSRQKISTSFFCIAAHYADSAEYAKKADTASFATRSDSAGKAGNAVSLGGYSAENYAKKSDVNGIKVDSARYSTHTDSLGGLSANQYVFTNETGQIRASLLYLADSIVGQPVTIKVRNYGTSDPNSHAQVYIRSDGGDSKMIFLTGPVGWSIGSDQSDGWKFKISSHGDLEQASRLTIKSNNGYIGIGTTNPIMQLDINGGIKIGDPGDNPGSEAAGTIRFKNGKFQGWTGTQWVDFH